MCRFIQDAANSKKDHDIWVVIVIAIECDNSLQSHLIATNIVL